MSTPPLVSIAIPAFNPDFFRRTLTSALMQDYSNLEVVICDDSATGEIEAICEELRSTTLHHLRYLRNSQRLGFARNLMACLTHSSGALIKFLCDDDTLLGHCVGLQAKILNEWPQVSMVINQRLVCAADDVLLPSRPLNFVISPGSAVLKGTDLLDSIADNAPNLFGGISHALFRRAQVEEYLSSLVQDGHGFVARLDLALYACLLRRGDLCSLQEVLSLERVYPGRLSHQSSMTEAFKIETEWLLQMLAARTGEAAPSAGWVRYLPLSEYFGGEGQVWEEMDMRSAFSKQIANFYQQVGTHSLDFAELYAQWLDCRELAPGQLRLLPKRIEQWPRLPRIVPAIICDEGDERALRVTLESLAVQSYAASQVLVVGPASLRSCARESQFILRGDDEFTTLNHWLSTDEQADWMFLLRAGDRLHTHALVIMAERMALHDDCMCLYSDEGSHDTLAPSRPIFKPDFNLDLMRSTPYVGRLLAFRRDALRSLGGFDTTFGMLAPHDALWRFVEACGLQAVEHIAEVLVHCEQTYADWQEDPRGHVQAARVVQAHLLRLGVDAQVEGLPGSQVSRITYLHERAASVSILIYVGTQLNALMRCVQSLLANTSYTDFEVLLVADEDTPTQILNWLAAMADVGGERLRSLQVPAQGLAASLNQASLHARGEYLLVLNSRCVLFDNQWLWELMQHAQRPEVGLVGPKLFSNDGRVVSAGMVLGLNGGVGSPLLGCAVNADSYMNRLRLVQDWTALSLDCLVIRRQLFTELEGLDTTHLKQTFFEADLCLRAREQGFLSVWTPFSKVVIFPAEDAQALTGNVERADREVFFERWLPLIARDPAYNPNLSLKLANFNFEPGLRSGWDPFIARAMPSVLALPSNTTAIGHYRVVQPFNELERAGWIQGRINYSTPEVIELERERPDVVILQCRYMPFNLKEISQFKRFSNARRIYELDDYVIEPSKKNDHVRNLPSNIREVVREGIGLCDRVVVSTEPLADALADMHHDIRVVPNMLSAPLWTGLGSQRQTSAKPRVGWAGGTSHRGDLELLLEVIKTLADEVDWVFFGMCPEMLRPYVKEYHTGISFAGYPRKLASLNLDLALAPLEQNLFNDCKSNLRLLEYGACGYPVICTDTKAYAGYLPCTRVKENTTQQWLEAIRMHLADPQASYRQGDALREMVLRDYVLTSHHLQHWANAWLAD